MGLNRRGVLVAGGAAAVGAAVGAAAVGAALAQDGGAPGAAAPAPAFDPTSWTSVRAQFALNPDVYNFTTFVFASHPAAVRDAINRHRAGLDADPYDYLGRNEFALDKAVVTAAARYLATDAGQIAFTDSTTMGLGLLYSGLRLAPGDEVLTTEHDFYSTHESLRLRGVATAPRSGGYASTTTPSTRTPARSWPG